MPTMTQSGAPSGRNDDSVRMPQTFRPPSTKSLGHLIPQRRPQTRSTARHTATAASGVTIGSVSVRRPVRHSTDRYSPSPGGDWKLRPMRPRPAVWQSAVTTASMTPSAARRRHWVLVESSISYWYTGMSMAAPPFSRNVTTIRQACKERYPLIAGISRGNGFVRYVKETDGFLAVSWRRNVLLFP